MKSLLLLAFFLGSCVAQAYTPDTRVFSGTLRDVWQCSFTGCGLQLNAGAPKPICFTNASAWTCGVDFDRAIGDDIGAVQFNLDTVYRRPVLASPYKGSTISSPSQFMDWYVDTPGFNIPFAYNFTASNANTGNSLIYNFNNQNFFPLDGMGFGNSYNGHNFAFCTAMHLRFTYQGNEIFTFAGDDDVWVFINDHLAMDLGGVHATEPGTLDLSWPANGCSGYKIPTNPTSCATTNGPTYSGIPCACILGLSRIGDSYTFDLFYNERHVVASDLQFSTDLFLQCPYYDHCGVCQGNGQSCCSCPTEPCTSSVKCDVLTPTCFYTPTLCPPNPDMCNIYYCNTTLNGCTTSKVVCNAPDVCTTSVCNPTVGCTNTPVNCNDNNPCTIDYCNTTNGIGCVHTQIPNCNPACGLACPASNPCFSYQCNVNTSGCDAIPTNCATGNLCSIDGCDNTTGCTHLLKSCNDNNPCTTDTCNPLTGCVFTPIVCPFVDHCTNNGTCNVTTGICDYAPLPLPQGGRCLGIYCDPQLGVVKVPTICPVACSVCDNTTGCGGGNCPSGFPLVQVAAGISAGVIAGVAIAGAAVVAIGALGSKKGYDAYMKYKNSMETATSNPLYTDNGLTGINPLHEG